MLRVSLEDCRQLLESGPADAAVETLTDLGFESVASALDRIRRLGRTADEREALVRLLPALLWGLNSAPAPDQSLLNFERLVDVVPNREDLFRRLSQSPRQVEILLRLFVSSQFLSEILLRSPEYLDRLTQYQRLAEIKLPPQFAAEAEHAVSNLAATTARLNALKRFQQWEILRLAACDTFHLMDLRTVTQQLSWLADSLVQSSLRIVARESGLPDEQLAIIAFGKLGAEELNYSSDIDLVFLTETDAERYWKLGQRLIAALNDATEQGFLYRVDMRLRPWGRSGPLVLTAAAYLQYLERQARPWELQALLKARTIAGAFALGEATLAQARTLIFRQDPTLVRSEIRGQLSALRPSGASREELAAEVKTGPGGIRDIEFLTQYLQIAGGKSNSTYRTRSTLEALIHLADAEQILPGEYRHLASAYLFQRSVEHSLQLMHNRQRYRLPSHPRELDYLAGRLDFPSGTQFLAHYTEHRRFVEDIVTRRLLAESHDSPVEDHGAAAVTQHLGRSPQDFAELFALENQPGVLRLLEQIGPEQLVATSVRPLSAMRSELTVAGYDQLGDLTLMCGLLFAARIEIESGHVFTGDSVPATAVEGNQHRAERRRKFVNVFTVRHSAQNAGPPDWGTYERQLRELLQLAAAGRLPEAQGRLARQLAAALPLRDRRAARPQPLEIAIDNERSDRETVLLIRGEDTPGFLYELCNALATSEISIQRMRIETLGQLVIDTLHVTTVDGSKITDPRRLQELRAAVVLTKQFTHLLPGAANPEAALTHFRELLANLFRQAGWLEQLASLQQPEVLSALAKMLGESDFLWEDFLRLHHEELLPLLADVQELDNVRNVDRQRAELRSRMAEASDSEESRRILNEFKDREMFRIDMRHVLGRQREFGLFSLELTWLAEAVIQAAIDLCLAELTDRYGTPRTPDGASSRLSVCALGKCGGSELGFASDIELMFLYDEDGFTDGPRRIANADYYTRLVESFTRSIQARRQGIFEIDLRLRPYGNAGALAVSCREFQRYYDPDGPAWPFERQALVKLRPVAGDESFGREIVASRDAAVYSERPFDLNAMRGLRERQLRELVQAGAFNAKLSPGGVVDCEYFVQALQMHYGRPLPELREPNTLKALRALENCGLIADRRPLRDAYRFLRRLIDALRIVRGNARDLTVPSTDSDHFEFLARRLGYQTDPICLQRDLERHTSVVTDHVQQLERLLSKVSDSTTAEPDP